MSQLYIQCNMGVAGDMLLGALYELLEDKAAFLETMNRLHPDIRVSFEPAQSCDITGVHARVIAAGQEEQSHDHHDHEHDRHHSHDHHDYAHDHDHDHEHLHYHDDPTVHEMAHGEAHHHHATLAEIDTMIDGFDLPKSVRGKAKEVYHLLAQAESKAHGVAVGEVHFHEVGALDAVADIIGVCYAMYLLGSPVVTASPVNLGSGNVRTAHGILPVPAPATAALLEGVPAYMSEVPGELCTPTGAALLRTFASSYGPMAPCAIRATGYGMGSKDFGRANCVRAFLCDTGAAEGTNGQVCELKANIDDMTGEALGYAMERLLDAGALDVFYTSVQTKKNRPAVLLTVLCKLEDTDDLAMEILRHTSTFGVRRTDCARYAMGVSSEAVDTAYGPIRKKTGKGYGLTKSKWEYEDAAAAARRADVPLVQVMTDLEGR